MRKGKRWIAMLLSAMMITGSLTGPVFASETDMTGRNPGMTLEDSSQKNISDDNSYEGEHAREDIFEGAMSSEERNSDSNGAETHSDEGIPEFYNVVLDANGGYFLDEWDDILNESVERTEVLNKTIPVGGTINTYPVFEPETEEDVPAVEATFAGWSLEIDGDLITQEYEKYAPSEDCTLYAVWNTGESVEAETESEEDSGDISGEFSQDAADGDVGAAPAEDTDGASEGFTETAAGEDAGNAEDGSAGDALADEDNIEDDLNPDGMGKEDAETKAAVGETSVNESDESVDNVRETSVNENDESVDSTSETSVNDISESVESAGEVPKDSKEGKTVTDSSQVEGTADSSVPEEAVSFQALYGAPVNAQGFIAPIDDPDASAVKISSAEDLSKIMDDPYGSYVLTKDIDLTGNGGWNPLGTTLADAFHGKLDGQGHKITGLTVSQAFNSGTIIAPSYTAGLFGVLDGAQIKNIEFENADISIINTSGYTYDSAIDTDHSIFAGIIAGYAKNSTMIYNCFTTGSVLAKAYGEGYSATYAGGLLGWADTALISYSYNGSGVQSYNGNAVQAFDAYAGGLAGCMKTEGVIDRSYNMGEVIAQTLDYGKAYGGGILGKALNADVRVTDSFNEGAVQGLTGNQFSDTAYAGGIAADFSGSIDRAYNSGTVIAQARDPYGIENTTAYAGGICGISGSSSEISNCASLQPTVSASASGRKNQYRISCQGTKSNNITINSMASGSTNDADLVKDLSAMKESAEYISALNWDFDRVWEMSSGKDFPQLKQVDVESEEYDREYVDNHLDFVNGSVYSRIISDYRWAQIYWSQENNFKSNLGGALYTATDTAVDLVTLNFKDLFEDNNPFKVMLADYVADQTAEESIVNLYKVTVPYSLDKVYKKVKGFIKENWKDSYGELSDEDLFWLFHYHEQSGEQWINQDFEQNLYAIVYDDSAEGLETALGITTETLDTILEQKKNLDNTIDWFNGLINYAGKVAAYVEADEEFHQILEEMCNNLPEETSSDRRYKQKLKDALESYTQYNHSQNLTETVFAEYIKESSVDQFEEIIQKVISKKVNGWMEHTFSPQTLSSYQLIASAADKTWTVMEYVTKNGELQECREMLKANAYFEDTTYRTMRSIEERMKRDSSFKNACLFDAAFKFFKETEIGSMDTVIQYLDTYQTSWLHSIRNLSNTFMNSAIEEVQINKMYLRNVYCHGTTYTLGGKLITIACPTNVYVYDDSGNLVASIENNVVTGCADGVLAYTADSVKLITVPADLNFNIRIDATDDGSMSYSVSEFDSGMENIQTTVYPNLTIQKDESYSGLVNNEIGTTPENYNLTVSDGSVIDTYNHVVEETNIPVESIEIDRGDAGDILRVGDNVQLRAVIDPENASNKSVVWTTSDQEVISVTENGLIEAKASGAATVSAQSLYGGVSDSITFIVLAEGQNLLITGQPAGASYTKNDTAEALEVMYYSGGEETPAVQWYVAQQSDLSDGKVIEGAVDQTCIPDTSETGEFYYYAVITAGEETASSEPALVEVLEKPDIASGTAGNGVVWKLDSEYVLTVSGEGEMDSFSTESEVPWNQYRSLIKSIKVEGNIPSIGQHVFSNCVEAVSISVTESAVSVAQGAFAGCVKLEELTLPFAGTSDDAVDSDAVLGAVFGSTSSGGISQYYKLEGTTLKGYSYAIPETLKKVTLTAETGLSFGTFYNCANIEQILLNEGIGSIGAYAFCGCTGLTGLVIPDSVVSVEEYALNGCNSLTSLSLPFAGAGRDADSTFDAVFGYIFGRTPDSENDCYVQYYKLEGTSISGYAYAVPDALKEIAITSASQIPFGTFSNLTNVQTITLNAGISGIGDYAFYNTAGLTDLYYRDLSENWESVNIGSNNGLDQIAIHFLDPSQPDLPPDEECQHVWGPETVTKEPTCTEEGTKTSVCTLCGEHKEETLAMLEHTQATPVREKEIPPTYDEEGSYDEVIYCTVCGKELSRTEKTTERLLREELEEYTITISPQEYTFTGEAVEPEITVSNDSGSLVEGADFDVAYTDNINAGKATVTITGKGKYTGTKTAEFTIARAAQSITASNLSLTYLKIGTITASGNKGTLSFKSLNESVAVVDASTGKVTAKGAGTTQITISAAETDNYKATEKQITVTVTKAAQSITAKAGASPIAVGKTTTVSVTGAKGTRSFKSSNTGIATVDSKTGRVTAKKVGTVKITAISASTSNYNSASKTVTIKVVPAATASLTAANQATGIKLTWKKVTGANGYKVYRGSTLIKTITSGSTVTYTDAKANTNGTKYTYKVAAKGTTGDSTLSKSVTVYRVARPAVSSAINSAAGKMTVKWAKNARASGYQIQYSTDKTFKTGNKAVTVAGASAVSKVIGSVAKGKTYYVRIRTYKTVGSAKYWSVWSAAKSVKITR